MKILIPASEGKSKIITSSNIKFENTDFMFEDSVRQVVNLLELIDEEDLRSIYGTSQEKSILFHRQNQSIFKEKCVPAITRYTGVVYENIGWNNLSKEAKEYLANYVFIFSGLFGMLKPLTPIPDYKLKMNVLSLQHHWRPILTEALNEEDFIIDLLPQVHRKAYTPNKNVFKVDFSVIKKGKRSAAGHFGKSVKGQFIKYLAENNIQSIDDFSGFQYDGFEWDGSQFIKKQS
tara:strand:+ start:3517 stop:4215 length:699 start_codon:yes stop_codon:yes gene_type:complete